MARSSSPPLIFDVDEMPSTTTLPIEETSILDFADVPEIESFPAVDVDLSEVHGTGETTLNAAERCASIVISFTRRLTSSDFTGFWYSCTSPITPTIPTITHFYTLFADLTVIHRVPNRLRHRLQLHNAPPRASPECRARRQRQASSGLVAARAPNPKSEFPPDETGINAIGRDALGGPQPDICFAAACAGHHFGFGQPVTL